MAPHRNGEAGPRVGERAPPVSRVLAARRSGRHRLARRPHGHPGERARLGGGARAGHDRRAEGVGHGGDREVREVHDDLLEGRRRGDAGEPREVAGGRARRKRRAAPLGENRQGERGGERGRRRRGPRRAGDAERGHERDAARAVHRGDRHGEPHRGPRVPVGAHDGAGGREQEGARQPRGPHARVGDGARERVGRDAERRVERGCEERARKRDSGRERDRHKERRPLRAGGAVPLARAEAARDEHRGADGEPERERVSHEADHRGVGERGEPPLPDERPHDEHVHDLVGGLQGVGAERRQREAREVRGRAAAEEVYFPHWLFLCTIETKRAAAAKPWPRGSNRARTNASASGDWSSACAGCTVSSSRLPA